MARELLNTEWMSQICTRHFGILEYNANSTLEFPRGLPGFEDFKRFVLIEQGELAPAVFLQSLDSSHLSFTAIPISLIDPEYQIAATPDDLRILRRSEAPQPVCGQDLLCLAILSATENGQFTANLLAPVLVNLSHRVAVQAVREDGKYSHQHPLNATNLRETPCW